ncbi:MAG TPA: site-2 protease family protein [Steroidobacteraceae bacterium]|nr:site-2 protease family protein [Steroidobacteraceae bacterium]
MIKLLLLLFKGATLGKFLLSGGTMLLSVLAYAWIFGWWYAVGFVALIFVHEMGHFLAARQRGLNVGLPTFIPFMGAWIEMKEMPHNAETEAYVGIAGPLIGTLGALLCFYAGRNYNSPLMLALAYSGFFLNLFNLIPLKPFDGGRVTGVISRKMWLIGAPILTLMFFYHPSPMLLIIALLAAPHVWHAMRGEETEEERRYHIVSMETRMTYGLVYIGLVIFLAMMSYELHKELPTLR